MRLRYLALCVLVAACSRPAPPEREVRVGFIAPLSGPLGERLGRPAREAAELAVEEINDRGGVELAGERYRVRAIIEDDEDRPELAVQAARKLVNQDDVVAIIGPMLSRNALAAAVVAENQYTPMICPLASHPELTVGRQYVFRATFGDEPQARALVDFTRGDLGAGKAAVLYDVASAYNRSLAELFQRAFEEAGGRVVAFETFTTGEREFRPQLTRIRDAAPDILFLPNYLDEVPLQVQQARELGITATFLGSDSWDLERYPSQDPFEGSFFVNEWHFDLANEKVASYFRAYEELHGQPPESSVAALNYDAFGLLFEALESLVSLEEKALRDALASISGYHGVTGTFSFRGQVDPAKDIYIFRVQDGDAVLHRRIEP